LGDSASSGFQPLSVHAFPVSSLLRRASLSRAVLIGASLLPFPALAQEHGQDDFHGPGEAEIVVTATGLRQLDMLAGTSVLSGEELQRNLSGQIGEVLTRLPGVSATSFAPGASSPVLRGFQGARVAVLKDGLSALDASGASADHAVAVDPLTADRVEVLRGPAVLLYGSQAIGGAVNIIGKRIPHRLPDEPVHVDAMAAIDMAANLREGGLSLDLPASGNLAIHLDGSWRRTDDLEVGGHVLARGLRSELLAEAAEEPDEAEHLTELANQRGRLPNSATRTWSLGGGFTLFSGDGHVGFSAGWHDSRYGVPGRPGAGHHHEEEGGEGTLTLAASGDEGEEGEVPVSIDLRSFRADMRGALALGSGAFSELRLRGGYTDYRHVELEGDEVGTRFFVTGGEMRAELVQTARGDWRGSVGGQYTRRNFRAIGPEALTPPHRTETIALFTVQEFPLGPLEAELGGRYEHSRISTAIPGLARSFDTFSGAFGLAHETAGGLRFGFNASRAERAPDGQELFADGPHIATQQFEIGDPTLAKEKAWGLEAYLRGRIGPTKVSLSAYAMWFDDYISLQDSGLEEDALPVFRVMQANARYSGLEGEISWPLVARDGLTLTAELQGDYVRARLSDGTPLPRIPPLSLLGALEAKADRFDTRLEVQWFDSQRRTAPFETRTGATTLVNASFAWHPPVGDGAITIMAQAQNIFDVVGRRHASFTKDFVPMAGRNFRLSAHVSF
jgi:iron complex outermembrane receptor protein